jgi:hypothetical protein
MGTEAVSSVIYHSGQIILANKLVPIVDKYHLLFIILDKLSLQICVDCSKLYDFITLIMFFFLSHQTSNPVSVEM